MQICILAYFAVGSDDLMCPFHCLHRPVGSCSLHCLRTSPFNLLTLCIQGYFVTWSLYLRIWCDVQLVLEQICKRRQLEDEMIRQVVVPLLQQISGTVYTIQLLLSQTQPVHMYLAVSSPRPLSPSNLLPMPIPVLHLAGSARSFSGCSEFMASFSWLCGEAY